MLVSRLLLVLLIFVFVPAAFAQSTLELDEFNAAFLQYGNTKDSDPETAREAARRAYELGKQIFGSNNERTAMLAINYSNLLQDDAQTQSYLDEAVTIYQSIFGFGTEALIDPLMVLGRVLSDADRYRLAAVYYRRAKQLAELHSGESSSKTGAIQLELGSIALRDRQLELAYTNLAAARQILQNFSDPGSLSNLARANLLLGEYYLQSEQYQAALTPLLTSLDSLSNYPNADVTLRNRIALIRAYENLDMRDQATIHCLAIGALRRIRSRETLRPLYSVNPAVDRAVDSGREQSAVLVSFTVDAEGFVRDPVLLSNLGSEVLATVFLDAIKQFRYAPRFVDGAAVATPNQQFVFRY